MARHILVYRIGQIGDTVVALPGFWVVRESYPDARLCLLCDRHPGRNYVLARELLDGAGLFDEFITYDVDRSATGRLKALWGMLCLLPRLRRERFDTLVYLVPSCRTRSQIARDRLFFRLAGIRRFIGMTGFPKLPEKQKGRPLPEVPREADLLLVRLAASGLPVPPEGQGHMDLGLGEAESEIVERCLRGPPRDGGRPWIAVGPGSKMPAKVWPEERYGRVVEALVDEFDVWPVVFGGAEDRELGDRLVSSWGRGYNAAGTLDVRAAAAAMNRCRLYLGNDTGTMHLAAAAGIRCVAVFSSREWAGMWYPYGTGHRVLRTEIDCDGCGLTECVERRKECILGVAVEEVLQACRDVIGGRLLATGV